MIFLPLHILAALGSLGYTAWLYFRPSRRGLHIAYGLVGVTLASGTWLVLTQPVHMLQACLTGVWYLAVMSLNLLFVTLKLKRES